MDSKTKQMTEEEEVVTVIHCWSAPRSRSTALLYSFEARNRNNDIATVVMENYVDDVVTKHSQETNWNTIALDEPLYATWLLNEATTKSSYTTTTTITRPYLPYIVKAATSSRLVVDNDDSVENVVVTAEDNDVMDPDILQQWTKELIPFSQKIQTAVSQLFITTTTTTTANKNSTITNDGDIQKVIFCKHMAKFWNVYNRERDEISEVVIINDDDDGGDDTTNHRTIQLRHYHVLLLRDPMDVVTSWNAIGTDVYGNLSSSSSLSSSSDNSSTNNGNANTIYEIGMVPLLQIYSELHNNTTTPIFVLDAEELIHHPSNTLQRLCHHCHIPYTPTMMSWKSGPHICDGPWAKYWYHDVHQTTGWITKTVTIQEESILPKKKYRTFNPTYRTALRASYPAYTFLYRMTLRYQQRTTLTKQQLYPDDIRNEHTFVYIGTSPGYGQCIPRDMAGISPFDSVVQGGDATWEGIRIYRGKILCLDKHLNRIMKSSKALGFNIQYMHTKEQITDAIFQVLAANNMRDGAHMRLTLTRGEKCTSSMNPNFNVYGTTLIIVPEWKPVHGVTTYDNTKGISLITASQRRNPPSCVDSKIHHNNLINNILPKIQANLAGVADAIMLDIDGYVSETNATNLFMVDEYGTLLTPHADHCLPGITRSAVLQLAKELHIPTEVRRISLAEFHSAQEVFTTGTMGELSPVVNIDGRIIGDGICGPITQKLQEIYQTLPERSGWSTPIPPFE